MADTGQVWKSLESICRWTPRIHDQAHLSLGVLVPKAMDWLLYHTHISRIWITQEVVVSRYATVKCGSFEINFEALHGAFFRLFQRQNKELRQA